ncbi:MAG TPA: SRPBCC domain-containing protein [Thermomicrobiales bacterium]|nr:SRPBCC domain-containing protein [Thermomicrobiales bacterium]
MSATRIRVHLNAPPAAVYRALLDPAAVAAWMVPPGMTSRVHAFDAREGGAFRISLTSDAATETGKTTAHTDTRHGRFVTLAPNERVVETVEFETSDPALQGEMTISFAPTAANGGTDLLAVRDHLPPGLSPADNELGCRWPSWRRWWTPADPTRRRGLHPSNIVAVAERADALGSDQPP